jgi:hypothetical protein
MNIIMNLQGMKPDKVLELAEWFPTFKGPLCFFVSRVKESKHHIPEDLNPLKPCLRT